MMKSPELKAVEKAREALRAAEKALDEMRSRRKVLCSCKAMHEIRELPLIVTHYYIEPHGCTGGDYWTESEWRFRCPTTGTLNRIIFNEDNVLYEKRDRVGVAAGPTFKSIYRALFASYVDAYDDRDPPAVWNDYINKHREEFELPLG